MAILNNVLNTDLITELIRITDNAENTNHINYLREDFLIKTLDKRTNETNCGSTDQYLSLLKTSPGEVKRANGLVSALGLGVALHVQGNAVAHMRLRTDAIDRLLHFTMTSVAAFNGIGSRWEQ